MTKKFHKELLELIQKNAGKPTKHTDLDEYLGTSHFRYPINIPTLRTLAREWAAAHKEISAKALIDLISSLVQGPSSTEKIMGGLLLDYFPAQRRLMEPVVYEEWLDHVEGWSEIDALCQGHFLPAEMFENWSAWKKMIVRFSKNKAIEKRRASMVLLVTPALDSGDERLSVLSLDVIENVKHEKDILITKAISWLMRSMVKHQRKPLEKYLEEQKDTLPKIAVREVMVKLTTGTKSGRKKL